MADDRWPNFKPEESAQDQNRELEALKRRLRSLEKEDRKFTRALSKPPKILFGWIRRCSPCLRVYYVAPIDGGPICECVLLMRGSTSVVGVYDATTLQVNTPVIFIKYDSARYGYIIGSVPIPLMTQREARNDAVAQEATVGGIYDQFYWHAPLLRGTRVGAGDFSGRGPIDSLELGEFCQVGPLGTMLFIDSFMSFIRANESCGAWFFVIDQLARLSGKNLEIWSGISEQQCYVDRGKGHYYLGIADNILSQIGIKDDELPPSSKNGNWNVKNNYKPFHFDQEYRSSLGAGHRQILFAEPEPEDHKFLEADEILATPLVDVYRSKTGVFGVKAASGLLLIKTPQFFVPNLNARPCDIHNEERKEIDDIDHTVNVPGDIKVNLVFDIHAKLFGWTANSGAHSSGLYKILKVGSAPTGPDLLSLRNNGGIMGDPQGETIWLGRDQKEFTWVPRSTAYFCITDDGSIVLADAYGSSIRMTGGRIYLDAPAETFITNGRNFVVLSGRDNILRARKSTDITAEENDVRIHGANNVHILASSRIQNGGILLESRATTFDDLEYNHQVGDSARYPGIHIISRKAPIVSVGYSTINFSHKQNITYAPEGLICNVGKYVIDVIGCYGAQVFDTRLLDEDSYYTKDEGEEQDDTPGNNKSCDRPPPKVNLYTNGATILDSELIVNYDTLVKRNIISGEHVYIAGAAFIDCEMARQLRTRAEQNNKDINYYVIPTYEQTKTEAKTFDELIADVQFSYRILANYKTDQFSYVAPVWMTILADKNLGTKWNTNVLEVELNKRARSSRKIPTAPYPGYEYIFGGNNRYESTIFVLPTYSDLSGSISTDDIEQLAHPYKHKKGAIKNTSFNQLPIIG